MEHGTYHLVQGGLFFLYSVLQHFIIRGLQSRATAQLEETRYLRKRISKLEKEVDECRA